MKKMKFLTIILASICLIVVGCAKGDTGPAGTTGKTGSANVKYSSWNSLNMTFNSNDSAYEQTITADSLTEAVLDSGIVLTYMKVNDPSTNQTQIVNADAYMQEIFSVGQIDLLSSYDYSGLSYRYVIIPGGVALGKTGLGSSVNYTKQQLKNMPYDQVIKLLNKSY